MRIGIEAKWYFDGPPGGRRVVRNLVRSLADVAPSDELHLFLDARRRGEPLEACVPSDRCHYLWAGNNQLSNVFVVPRVADRLGLDAVVYQNFVPRAARHARIAFVHDVIFESHPSFFSWRERAYFTPLRYLTSHADRVCTVSESERARLVSFGYATPHRIDVVPNGVDAEFEPCAPPSASVQRVRRALALPEHFVLYVGRLNVRKNVATLLRAMALVRHRELELVIVGAPDRTTTGLRAAAGAASDRVRWLDQVTDDDLPAIYAAATVFCFPSLDEGFGLTPLEAMAAGTPTIVSAVPALIETCGDAAVAVDPTDPAAIAAAIDAIVDDPVQRASLRDAGRRRALGFSWERSSRRLLESVRTAVRSRT